MAEEQSLQFLDEIEHVQTRPGMYVGDVTNPKTLVRELVDNALDEYLNGYADKIEINYADVPSISEVTHLKGDQVVREALLTGGDDYELLFTVAAGGSRRMDSISARLGLALTRIGRVVAGDGVRVLDASGEVIAVDVGGYEHFA